MGRKSQELFAKALRLMPGGVNSPVRAFRAVGGDPVFISSGKGSRITDVDGRSYIDFVMSWGPLVLGHCHPEVVEAVANALDRDELRSLYRGGSRARGASRGSFSLHGTRAARQFRDGGDDFGSAGRASRDRPRENIEVRRVLSRARR